MTGSPDPTGRPEAGTLAAFFHLLIRRRRLITLFVAGVVLAAVAVAFLLPVRYTARVVLLPGREEEPGLLASALSVLGTSLPGLPTGGLRGGFEVEAAILRSDRLGDAMDARFRLGERYKSKNRDLRLKQWRSLLGVKTSREGMLVVSYRDRDPAFAAEVAGAAVEEMTRIQAEVRTAAGRRLRMFLEERVHDTRVRLAALEDSLAAFQAGHGGAGLSPGAEGTARAGAELLADRVRLETETEVLRATLSPDAPALRRQELRMTALDRELARLPALGTATARLVRDVAAQERAYAYLSAQLEEARLAEARTIPNVQILDPPALPTRRSHPKRALIVAIAFAAAAALAPGLAAISEAWRRAREAHDA